MINDKLTLYVRLATVGGEYLDPVGAIKTKIIPLLTEEAIYGATITQSWGVWAGVLEQCLVITLLLDVRLNEPEEIAERLAKELCVRCSQDSVLYTYDIAKVKVVLGE